MTQPTFDAAYNARVLAVLNNAMARLYILPYLRMASLEDVVKLWLSLREQDGTQVIDNKVG